MKLGFSRQIFKEKERSNIKFHQNPSSGIQVVPCGRTGITKVIVAFRNFAKTAEKEIQKINCCAIDLDECVNYERI
jgi:ribosomal protein L18E